eukprot:TRINITY_DN16652_c0_g2_i1.p1 TRINITY_DN16652_c0_g2~~TRINITY_DN16652_c0_g2_i1.p1  ORF type:complete len:666 (-),score=142.28 TRINITY_DN16652_c0_g2_i1:121-2118(-)
MNSFVEPQPQPHMHEHELLIPWSGPPKAELLAERKAALRRAEEKKLELQRSEEEYHHKPELDPTTGPQIQPLSNIGAISSIPMGEYDQPIFPPAVQQLEHMHDNTEFSMVPISNQETNYITRDDQEPEMKRRRVRYPKTQDPDVQRALNNRTPEGKYKCPKCPKEYKRRESLLSHLNMHYDPLECEQCHMRFPDRYKLKRHQVIHTGDRPFKCPHCTKTFTRQDKMRAHARSHVQPYKCSQCSKCFSDSTELARHSAVHTGDKPYKCPHCNRSFTRPDKLRDHMHVHPYVCPKCNLGFRHETLLVAHMVEIHAEQVDENFIHESKMRAEQYIKSFKLPRNHKCSICPDVSYSTHSALLYHVRSKHSDELPFKCPAEGCGEAFASYSSRNKHMDCNHPEQAAEFKHNRREWDQRMRQDIQQQCGAPQQINTLPKPTNQVPPSLNLPLTNINFGLPLPGMSIMPGIFPNTSGTSAAATMNQISSISSLLPPMDKNIMPDAQAAPSPEVLLQYMDNVQFQNLLYPYGAPEMTPAETDPEVVYNEGSQNGLPGLPNQYPGTNFPNFLLGPNNADLSQLGMAPHWFPGGPEGDHTLETNPIDQGDVGQMPSVLLHDGSLPAPPSALPPGADPLALGHEAFPSLGFPPLMMNSSDHVTDINPTDPGLNDIQ